MPIYNYVGYMQNNILSISITIVSFYDRSTQYIVSLEGLYGIIQLLSTPMAQQSVGLVYVVCVQPSNLDVDTLSFCH